MTKLISILFLSILVIQTHNYNALKTKTKKCPIPNPMLPVLFQEPGDIKYRGGDISEYMNMF